MKVEKIYFAGGCFWGVEHFFKGVDGVVHTTPGYANGVLDRQPSYEEVYTDGTGFAETVEVLYDSDRVSLAELVDLYFTIVDPLSLNRQGGDVGTRYRTGVYYIRKEDLPVVEARFAEESARLAAPLAVELEPLRRFYPAEEYHRDYLHKNPGGYCHIPLPAFRYLRLYQDLRVLLGDEPDRVARMASAAALLHERMKWHWVGFYRVVRPDTSFSSETGADGGDAGVLVLGPFAGPVACLRIGYGKGVCGTAWKERRTVLVPDVDRFPGHIACSSLSRSEIVVPVFDDAGGRSLVCAQDNGRETRTGGSVMAVLDIDSAEVDAFGPVDARWLEKIARLVIGPAI